MRSFFRAMLDCHDQIFEKRDRAAAMAYSQVVDFLKNGRYSSYKNANRLAELKLQRRPDAFIAEQLGVSPATLRIHTKSVSDALYKLMGTNFFDMLSNFGENRDSVKTVLFRLEHYNVFASDVILTDVISAIHGAPEEGAGSYDLATCGAELDFLQGYSKAYLQVAMGNLDMAKLRYLLDVMDGKAGSSHDWQSVMGKFLAKE